MKFRETEANNPAQVDNTVLRSEYEKVRSAVDEFLPGTEFVLVFSINQKKVHGFANADVPADCIVIAKEEQESFYGELYHHRLDRF